MNFAGELQERRLGDVLAALGDTEQSGTLQITHQDGKGIVVFYGGRIIFAATHSARETLGGALIAQELISQAQLEQALDLQQTVGGQRLGAILAEMGAVSEQDLRETMTEQIQHVVDELLGWERGAYSFEPQRLPNRGEIRVSVADVVPSEALGEEKDRTQLTVELRQMMTDVARELSPANQRLALLKRTLREIRSPEFTGEMVLKILSFSQEVMRRGVLFLVRPSGFSGMGQFGVELGDADVNQRIRELSIPLDQPGILNDAAERMELVHGPPADTEGNSLLFDDLGGTAPAYAMAVPMVVGDRVMTVLYGDNLPSDEAVESTDEIEMLMIQAGMSVEKNLYQRRLEHYERLRQLDGTEIEVDEAVL